MKRLRFPLLVVMSVGLVTAFIGTRRDNYLPGDCPYYAFTTLSVLHDGDFDLSNQLGIQTRNDLKSHEGYFAVSPQNVVVPKHSLLLPLLSIPAVAVFGVWGFLITNMVVMAILIVGIAALGGYSTASRIVAILVFFTSTLTFYCFNYSNDVLAAALIAWAYTSAKNKYWLVCGLLSGLAVWSKVYAAVILLPLAILIVPQGIRAIARTWLTAAVALAPMLILNAMLYGGPLVTGYDRDARVTETGFQLTEHYSRFHQPFLQGLANVLFDRRVGMIATAPLWFLWPAGLWLLRHERWVWAAALGAILNVCFFAPYDEWNASQDGNRFLFPAVALGGALLASLVQSISNHSRPHEVTSASQLLNR